MDQENLAQRIAKADSLYTQGRFDEALDAYNAILLLDNAVAWVHSRIGAIFAQTGREAEAEDSLLRAIELDVKLPQAHSNLGNLYYAKGNYEAALAKYKEAIALSPETPVYYENLHAAYKKLGKLSEAVTALKQAHRFDRGAVRTLAKEKLSHWTLKGRTGCFGAGLLIALIIAVLL